MLTECVQYSIYTLKKPLFALYLDAKSAFDVVQRILLVNSLYHVQSLDQSILYLDNRLANRETVVDWGGNLMGPIKDEQGLEQGGCSSSELYKIFGREQLDMAQSSRLGVVMGSLTISAIGQADDTVLVSNSIHDLSYLLHLTKIFCSRKLVDLCADKTKLQAFSKCSLDQDNPKFEIDHNPIKINDMVIPLSNTAEHVGVLRSVSGNSATLLARFAAHRGALSSVLHTGLARNHRGNPSSGLKIEKLYALPVLLSGISSLVLSKKDLEMIEAHYRETLRKLLRLPSKTPRSVIYFLAGSLPGDAFVHLRQLSIFGMISRQPQNLLHQHAENLFTAKLISPKSWFNQIRDYCLMYGLPHPASLLASPFEKFAFKKLVKKKVIDYWEHKLRDEASSLRSLAFFFPQYMSLTCTHPLFVSAGNSPAKVSMASIQAIMLSGRYRCDALVRHWSPNITGFCSLSINCANQLEDIPHILGICSALSPTRSKLYNFTKTKSVTFPDEVKNFVLNAFQPSSPDFIQALLDCSVIPAVIRLSQNCSDDVIAAISEISRTWIYVIHRERLKLRGQWSRAQN